MTLTVITPGFTLFESMKIHCLIVWVEVELPQTGYLTLPVMWETWEGADANHKIQHTNSVLVNHYWVCNNGEFAPDNLISKLSPCPKISRIRLSELHVCHSVLLSSHLEMLKTVLCVRYYCTITVCWHFWSKNHVGVNWFKPTLWTVSRVFAKQGTHVHVIKFSGYHYLFSSEHY